MPTTGHQVHRAGSAMFMGCQHVRKRVSERDLNPHGCDLRCCSLSHIGKQITAGQRVAFVPEARVEPFAHPVALTTGFSLVLQQ